MEADPASLDNLRDITVPPPVSWWPLAPGWWVIMAVILVATVSFGYRAWRRWKANAYRRDALAELDQATEVASMVEILKRTALVAYPRAEVAALTGSPWCAWLEKTGRERMSDGVRAALTKGVFARSSELESSSPEVSAFVSAWITRHQCGTPTVGGERSC